MPSSRTFKILTKILARLETFINYLEIRPVDRATNIKHWSKVQKGEAGVKNANHARNSAESAEGKQHELAGSSVTESPIAYLYASSL